MKKKFRKPRQYALVKFDFESFPKKFHRKFPFKRNHPYVFFGEIPNMPGHCIVADHKTGEIFSGYHTEDFIELSVKET